MNGTFNEHESRHLTADERLHYVELGLCPPVGRELLQDMLASEKENARYLRYQLDDANETAVSLQNTIEEQDTEIVKLRRRVEELEAKLCAK